MNTYKMENKIISIKYYVTTINIEICDYNF